MLHNSHSSSLPALHGQHLGDTVNGLPARLTAHPVLRQLAVHAWRALILVPFTACPWPIAPNGTRCLIWRPRCPLTTRQTRGQQRAVVTSPYCPLSLDLCRMVLPGQTDRGRSRLVVEAPSMTWFSDRFLGCLQAQIVRRTRPCLHCRGPTRTRAWSSEEIPSPGEARDAAHARDHVPGLHAATSRLSSRAPHDFTISRLQRRRKYLTEPRR